jgi:imidazolonepropionase-like amidohydrolase
MRGLLILLWTISVLSPALRAQLAVRGEIVHTMAGPSIANGVVLIQDGKIERIGPAADVAIPAGYRTLSAAVVTPGLIDAHTVIGLSGYLNQNHDQDQLERSLAIQPDLSAVDAYNPREVLIEWARSYGVTTLHTGHAPGQLVAGQAMIVKTRGRTVDEALVNPFAMVAATLGESARAEGGKSPGTRAKMAAMLRGELLKAQEYARKTATEDEDKKPARDLKAEVLMRVLDGEVPLLVTVHRSHDVLTALRIAEEFNIKIVLDGVSE